MSKKISELQKFVGTIPSTADIPINVLGTTYRADPSQFLTSQNTFLEITQTATDGQTNFNIQANLVVRQVLLDRIELLPGDFTYNATSGVLSIINADLLPLEVGNTIRVRQF